MEKVFKKIYLIVLRFFMPKRVRTPMKVFGNYKLPETCLPKRNGNLSVLSVGVGNDVRFDDAILRAFPKTKLTMMDPTPHVADAIKKILQKKTLPFRFKAMSLEALHELFSKVTYVPHGLGDVNTEMRMHLKEGRLNSSFFEITGSETKSKKVKIDDVVSLLKKYPGLDILKLDIEGYAGRVLLRTFRAGFAPKIIVGEFELFSLGALKELTCEMLLVLQIADQLGYKFTIFSSHGKPTVEFCLFLES